MTVPIAQYVNTGAPFLREDGSWVQTLDQFAASAKELQQFRYKLRLVTPPLSEITGSISDTTPAQKSWPMPMAPALYLQVAPEGEHAELARQLVTPAPTPVAGESGATESVSDAHD